MSQDLIPTTINATLPTGYLTSDTQHGTQRRANDRRTHHSRTQNGRCHKPLAHGELRHTNNVNDVTGLGAHQRRRHANHSSGGTNGSVNNGQTTRNVSTLRRSVILTHILVSRIILHRRGRPQHSDNASHYSRRQRMTKIVLGIERSRISHSLAPIKTDRGYDSSVNRRRTTRRRRGLLSTLRAAQRNGRPRRRHRRQRQSTHQRTGRDGTTNSTHGLQGNRDHINSRRHHRDGCALTRTGTLTGRQYRTLTHSTTTTHHNLLHRSGRRNRSKGRPRRLMTVTNTHTKVHYGTTNIVTQGHHRRAKARDTGSNHSNRLLLNTQLLLNVLRTAAWPVASVIDDATTTRCTARRVVATVAFVTMPSMLESYSSHRGDAVEWVATLVLPAERVVTTVLGRPMGDYSSGVKTSEGTTIHADYTREWMADREVEPVPIL